MTATYCVNLSPFPVSMPYCFPDLLIRLFYARFAKQLNYKLFLDFIYIYAMCIYASDSEFLVKKHSTVLLQMTLYKNLYSYMLLHKLFFNSYRTFFQNELIFFRLRASPLVSAYVNCVYCFLSSCTP